MGRLDVVETGRRRRWLPEQKDMIVAESYTGEASVSEIARRHAITPSQLFGWRRQARLPPEPVQAGFVPAMMLESAGAARPYGGGAPVIVVELAGGGRVMIGERAPVDVVSAVLAALVR